MSKSSNNNFNQYNEDGNLKSKKEEKYLYLDCIINLFNKFATCVKIYQKEKIRQDEFLLFEKEINTTIQIIKDFYNNENNNDMPYKTKYRLLELVKKSENNWEISIFEKYKNELFSNILEEKFDSNKNIKDYEIFNSKEIKKHHNTISNFDKNKDTIKSNRQYKSVSPVNNNNYMNYNTISGRKRKRSSSNNSNYFQKVSKVLPDLTKKFEYNLNSFKNHIIKYKSNDNFKKWDEIDNLFLNKKIKKLELFKSLIEACKLFISNDKDIYYVDIYIKIIFEYYYNYLRTNDFNEIINALLEELSHLSDEKLQKEDNQFLNNILTIIIYHFLQNKYITMNTFNYFCKGYYNKEIKKNIFNILYCVCSYNKDNKKMYLKELMNTKFANINRNYYKNINYQ